MLLLRLTQHAESQPDYYRVEVSFEADNRARQAATARFQFQLTPADQADLRWYLEDYLQYPMDPAPKIADRIERRMIDIGTGLFDAVFEQNRTARDLWAKFREQLDDARVEIVTTDARQAAAIPWELLRDPSTDRPLALRARAFVRAQPETAQTPEFPQSASGPIRILLVICRPGGREDVPFRSVASRILKGLSEEARAVFQLDVLRPPTLEQLSRVLAEAKSRGEPYHIVHFDGHGTYTDLSAGSGWNGGISPLLYKAPRPGRHGYLAFENPKLDENLELVDGSALGQLLVENDAPVLVLNACRSAHTDPHGEPKPEEFEESSSLGSEAREQVHAFGSLAQEVMDAGVPGVVAMRYNVYVVTAAQFVADLYAALAQGQSLGEAVTLGRKQLAAQPLRSIAFDPIPLQDWPVPLVYEAAEIRLFPKRERAPQLSISLRAGETAPARGAVDPELEKRRPDVGFFGRDETLLALDRAFDTQRVVLLHAYAGSGKTTTAVEFVLWYQLTGGLPEGGPILFTSFEQYTPLPRVLDQIGQVFGQALEAAGVHWLALSDADRRSIALQVMSQIPVLWVWDNVEPVAGFPAGRQSAWNSEERKELKEFLLAARGTQAKFLLTSRRDERSLLGELPMRLTLPPMPMQERVQLARALAEKHGRRITEVEDWRPLLGFTQGNPLAITVLVGQALRDGLKTRKEIEAFVARLRAGEAAFEDEASEGRSKSLGASLSYGFEHAFIEDERKVLALLHFFQGFVDVDTLRDMGAPEADWCLPEVRGLTREAGIALLDRAAEVGLLTAHGGGYYSIHPALPWYFKSLFEQYYSGQLSVDSAQPSADLHPSSLIPHPSATRAYVEAMGELGNYYHDEYGRGNRDVIDALSAEEANLLHARRLARSNGWWSVVINMMQGLRVLYDHAGRRAEWKRLVEEIVPDFVDPATDGPLPGREEQWILVSEYRVLLAGEGRQWAEAERLQRVNIEWHLRRAAPTLAAPFETLDNAGRNAIRSLAVSLAQLADILREQGKPETVNLSEEAITLYQRIGDRAAEAVRAFNLGHVYMDIPALRDLDQAERWYRRSLELLDERDRLGRARSVGQLGLVARERFK
ncbi:MAG TPA: CHAT domain-containing protein, partial [Anaerolineae bacterium]|nr:CHAT domain-containing protein [Anaerolineae bacterium]